LGGHKANRLSSCRYVLEVVWAASNVNNVWQHQCFSFLILRRGRVWTGLLPTAGWLDRKGDGICTVLIYMYMQ